MTGKSPNYIIKNSILLLTLFLSIGLSVFADTTITILHSNDVHAWLTQEKNTKYGKNLGGLARSYEYISQVKKENPNTLVLSAGDIFQGTPFYCFFKGEASVKAFEASGYDATTLGNHEFDNGLKNLLTQLKKTRLQLLCCNVFYKKNGKLIFPPFKIFFRGRKKIAVIGSIGNSAWKDIGIKARKPAFERDQIKSVKAIADVIRPYVDLVVVLSHAGVKSDKIMAAKVNSIDVIVGGHSHTFLFKPIFVKNENKSSLSNNLDGTIVVQDGKHGIFLGRLDITFNEFNKISSYTDHLEKIDDKYAAKANNPVSKAISVYKSKLDKNMNQIIGYASSELNFHKNNKYSSFSTIGNFATEAMRKVVKSDICILNTGAIRGFIYAGKIPVNNIFTALPFDNTIVVFKMTGKAVQRMLNIMSSFEASKSWYQCSGVNCVFNEKKHIAENVKINGKAIQPNKVYTVSTSSFVAEGNLGGDVLFKKALGSTDSGIFMRDAIISYIKKIHDLGDYKTNGIEIN